MIPAKRKREALLLPLPREVRDMIYDYVVASKAHEVSISAWKHKSTIRPGEHMYKLIRGLLAECSAQTSSLRYAPSTNK
jgi:hypothetical protein